MSLGHIEFQLEHLAFDRPICKRQPDNRNNVEDRECVARLYQREKPAFRKMLPKTITEKAIPTTMPKIIRIE